MNKEQKRFEKIKKLARAGGTDKDLEILDAINDLEDKIDAEIPSIKEVISRVKGEKGDPAITPTNEELISLLKPFIPEPKNGEDYVLTDSDKKEIASQIKVPIVEKEIRIEKTETIKEVPVVTNNVTNEIKEVAVTDEPIVIAEKLNTLKEVVDQDVIKGLSDLKKRIELSLFNPTMGPSFADLKKIDTRIDKLPTSGGVTGSSDSSLTIVGSDAIINTAHANTWTGKQTFGNNMINLAGADVSTAFLFLNSLLLYDGSNWTPTLYTGLSASTLGVNGFVQGSRTITAGTGLTGGGNLTADRTLAIDFTRANTWTADQTISSAALIFSGNISSPAWTTNGVKIKGTAATFTDTTSSGTVALAYTSVFGGNTIAASSAVTFTEYDAFKISDPIAGTNVTITNKYALRVDSLKVGTSPFFTVNNAGTVTAGTWNGSTIGIANGGTNTSSFSNTNGVVYYDGLKLTNISAGSAGTVLLGTGGAPSFSTLQFSQLGGLLNLASQVSGTLGTNNGGTGASTFTQGSVVFAGASGVYTQNNTNFFYDASTSSLVQGFSSSPVGLSSVRQRVRSSGTSRMIRWENSTVAGNGYGGIDIFAYDTNAGGVYSGIQFASSDTAVTTMSIGPGQGQGALGYGGNGILNIGGWSTGNFGAITFLSNNTTLGDVFAGRIDWINDTGNNAKKSSAYITAQVYDSERKAMGLQFGTNSDSSGYPQAAMWVTPERLVAQATILAGYGLGGLSANGLGLPDSEYMAIYDYHNNNTSNNDGTSAFFGSLESGLGSEELTNPTFTGSATGWTLGTGWAYNSNDVAKNVDGTGTLSQTFTAVIGQRYTIYLDVLSAVSGSTVGTATITITGGTTITLTPKLRFGTASFQYSFTANATSQTVTITPTNTSRFRIDQVSVKKMTWGGIRTAGNSYIGGNLLVGIGASASAKIHIAAGSATASTAPLKFTSGTILTTAEAGVHEYNGNHYLTNANVRFSVGGSLFDHFTDVTVGGAETDIYTDTLAANTLGVNGGKIIAEYGVNFVTVGTQLTRLQVYLAGTSIWDSTAVAPSTGTTSARVYVEIIRVSSTVVRYSVSLNTTGASGYVYAKVGELTGLTLSNTNILKLTGISSGVGSSVGDIVGKMAYLRFAPVA